MPTPEQNAFWNTYNWPLDGDEWQDQAQACGQPYHAWKRSLIETFIAPYAPGKDAVEIGPGHGRWSIQLCAHEARSLHLVELSEAAIEFLRALQMPALPFTRVTFHHTRGADLGLPANSADFVFSYDSLVHCERLEIERYIEESAHVLRPGGTMVIHTPGDGGKLGGKRGDVSKAHVARATYLAGFDYIQQTDSWGPNNEFNCRLFGDIITIATKRPAR